MKKIQTRNSMLLLLAALIWGMAFIAQDVGMDYVGPSTFNCMRFFLGSIVLLPVILLRKEKMLCNEKNGKMPTEVIGGIFCGIFLFVGSSFQQHGIQYTTVGKAGFITSLYIIIVPLLGIFVHKKVGWKIWISVAVAIAGMYLLCMTEHFSISKGDWFLLACSFAFALHILVTDHFTEKVNGVIMSSVQFLVAGILSMIAMLLFENPRIGDILNAWKPIGYAGVFSCGVAYTLQIVGQKDMNPTVASLLLSMESVFSVLFGWLLLKQQLSEKELMGCVCVFVAIILAQLPEKKSK